MTIKLEGLLADRSWWTTDHCPVARALDAIGPPSAVLVLREAYFGTTRFDDFVTRLRMTESAVTARLRQLVEVGILSRTPYREPGQRTRHEYHLTQMGLDLLPALVALMAWSDTHLQTGTGRRFSLAHDDCGEPVTAEVRCAAGHEIDATEIVMRPVRRRSGSDR